MRTTISFVWDISKIMLAVIIVVGLTVKGYLSAVAGGAILSLYAMFRGAVRGSSGITKTTYWIFEVCFIFFLCVNILAGGGNWLNLFPLLIEVFTAGAAWIIGLFIEGYMSVFHVLLFATVFYLVESYGKRIGGGAVRGVLHLGVPMAMFIFFVMAYGYGGGDASRLAGSIIVILIPVLALYWMMFGVSSSNRKR